MKITKIIVPIITEEYSIVVYMGNKLGILKNAAKYLNCSYKAVEADFGNCRGKAWNALDEVYGRKHPLIVIDADLPAPVALATIAHEASHAMDFIETFIGINDKNGEVHAHGIAAVMRVVGKLLLLPHVK